MLREIVIPKETEYLLKIPVEYINKTIEILVLPLDDTVNEPANNNTDIILKTSGILKNREVDPLLWQKSIRSEWEGRS